jgi:PPOX class probable F420-dependent enzyme
MARTIATATPVELAELLDFVRARHHLLLATTRSDGRPQLSPVSGGVDEQGRIVISSYPGRAKVRNAESRPQVSVCVLSDDFDGPWVQVDGEAEVLHMPEAEDALVDYFRCIAGEHPDWDEYRAAMRVQGKSLLRVTPTRWGPVATGGFPADVAARLGG